MDTIGVLAPIRTTLVGLSSGACRRAVRRSRRPRVDAGRRIAELRAPIRIADSRRVPRFRICGSTFAVLEGDAGEVVLQTPQLNGTLACRAMIVNIRLTAPLDERYDRTRVADGHAFTLRGPSGSPIAMSPVFASEVDRERAIAFVQRHAASAPVEQAPLGAAAFDRERVLATATPTTSHEEHLAADDGRESVRDA